MQVLILASGSQYRRELLSRLGLPFSTMTPGVNESAQPAEPPLNLAQRLAAEKAAAIVKHAATQSSKTAAIVIASDQVGAFDGQRLEKPMSEARAYEQLHAMSGQQVMFYTAVHMTNSITGESFAAVDETRVQLRKLSLDEIHRYVELDKPLDCAGSFKVESLGITLFDLVASQDPTALIGLPLIAVSRGLRQFGFALP